MDSDENSREFYAIRKQLVESRSLYVDPDFPPSMRSLTFSGQLTRNLSGFRQIEWKRPVQLSRSPRFVTRTASRSDLDQGSLGNCWFVAAASLLVNGPSQQFERVVPLDQGFDPAGYAGIFHFKFWWYGKWKEVIIDDFLPTDGSRLIYCQNDEDKNEYWGALLEKAYAKLRGCYESLDGGKVSDALVDMTGGLAETINVTDKSDIPDNLYNLLWTSSQMNSMIGGSIHLPDRSDGRPEVRRSNGLYMGHAYSITALSVVPWNGRKMCLLRVRNPWGRKEWNGPWSDTSDEIRNLPMDMKRKLNIVVEEEGEFWMSYDDFIANFDEVQLCHLQPDAIAQELANNLKKQNWSVTVYHDAWIKGVTAGGCGNAPYQRQYWKNPQFQIQLKDVDDRDSRDVCTMIVSLLEKEKDNRSNIAIGFDIYKVRNPQSRPMNEESFDQSQLVHRKGSGKYQYYREVTMRFELKPGYYVIVPSTFHPNEEAQFMLRIFTEKEVDSTVVDEVGPPSVLPESRDKMSELFSQFAGEDGKMDFKELRRFIREATREELKEPIEFNREACRSLLTMMDNNKSGYLDLDEARKLLHEVKSFVNNKSGYLNQNEARKLLQEVKAFVKVFRSFDADRSNSIDTLELGSMFNKLGFPVSRMVLTSIVRRYGSRQRTIDLEDFIVVVCKLITMYNVFKDQQVKTGGPEDVAQFTRNEFLQYTMFC